jgi:hypothetical protein
LRLPVGRVFAAVAWRRCIFCAVLRCEKNFVELAFCFYAYDICCFGFQLFYSRIRQANPRIKAFQSLKISVEVRTHGAGAQISAAYVGADRWQSPG